MKSLIKSLSLLAVVGFFAASCEKDPCKDVETGTHGTCLEGIVTCNTGYEKNADGLCEIEWSAKFLGNLVAASDTVTSGPNAGGPYTYNTTISRVSEVKLSTTNFSGFGASNVVEIDVISSTELSINYTDVAGRAFVGSGSINNKTITLNYTVTFPSGGGVDNTQTIITLP